MKNNSAHKFSFKYFFVIFSSIILVSFVFSFSVLFFEYQSIIKNYKIAESQSGQIIDRDLDRILRQSINDLLILSDEVIFLNDQENTTRQFVNLLNGNSFYDHVRLIDEEGNEIVRVNYDQESKTPQIVSPENLQNKADRYYFRDGIDLNIDQIYISPVDINQEYGVAQDGNYVIRVSRTITNQDEEKFLVIFNIKIEKLFDYISAMPSFSEKHQFFINTDGTILSEKGGKKFGELFPTEWQQFEGENAQIQSTNGLFTIVHLELDSLEDAVPGYELVFAKKEFHLHLVDFIEKSQIDDDLRPLVLIIVLINIITVVGAGIFSYFFVKLKQRDVLNKKLLIELNEILKVLNKILRHDILNAMTVVAGEIDMYFEYNDPKDVKVLLKRIVEAMNRGKKTISGMKDLEKAVASGEPLQTINVCEVVNEAKKEFKDEIKVSVSGCTTVLADSAFSSVVTNFIRNAVVHGKAKNLKIVGKKTKNIIEISFIDDGVGIPDDVKPKLFNEGAKFGETGHTGLGLYIIKRTIERYGGSVSVNDNKPKGTTFIVKIPLS